MFVFVYIFSIFRGTFVITNSDQNVTGMIIEEILSWYLKKFPQIKNDIYGEHLENFKVDIRA